MTTLADSVFQKQIRRPLTVHCPQLQDWTPRTYRVKGFVGEAGSVWGRYGVYGHHRSDDMVHTMTKSASHPELNFATKSGYKKVRRRIGKSNRSQNPLQFQSQRQFTPNSLASLTHKELTLKTKSYAATTMKNAITKRKKLGIKSKKRKRPKSCPGIHGTTQRSIAMTRNVATPNRERVRKCVTDVAMNPFVDHSGESMRIPKEFKQNKAKELYHSLSTSNLKHLEELKRSCVSYDELMAIRNKRNYDEIKNVLNTTKNSRQYLQTTNDILYRKKDRDALSFLCDKQKWNNIHQSKQSKINQHRQEIKEYKQRKNEEFERGEMARCSSIRNLRQKYTKNIKEQANHEYWQRWNARRAGMGQFSPTNKRKQNSQPARKFWHTDRKNTLLRDRV